MPRLIIAGYLYKYFVMVDFIIYPIAVTVSFDFRFLPNFSRHQSFSVYDVSICVLSYVLVSRWTLRIKKMHEGKSLQYIVVWFIAFCQAKCPSMPILLAEESRENLLHCRSYIRPRN